MTRPIGVVGKCLTLGSRSQGQNMICDRDEYWAKKPLFVGDFLALQNLLMQYFVRVSFRIINDIIWHRT